jgi:hypothetical protein
MKLALMMPQVKMTEWFKRFKNGNTPVDEGDWSGRSSALRSKPDDFPGEKHPWKSSPD